MHYISRIHVPVLLFSCYVQQFNNSGSFSELSVLVHVIWFGNILTTQQTFFSQLEQVLRLLLITIINVKID